MKRKKNIVVEIEHRRYIDLSHDPSQKYGGNYHTSSEGRECTMYIIECYNEKEKFIKIGVTSRSIKKRFSKKESMPYSYRVVKEVKSYDNKTLYYLEKMCLGITEFAFHTPSIPFNGSTECRSVGCKDVLLSYLADMGSLEENRGFLKQMAGKDEDFSKKYEEFMGVPFKYASKMFNKKAGRYLKNGKVGSDKDYDLPFDLNFKNNSVVNKGNYSNNAPF